MTIKFKDNGIEHSICISVEDVDFWYGTEEYDIHYCENYNQVCVYAKGDTNYKTIYSQSIKI